jgi:hypothetical protein
LDAPASTGFAGGLIHLTADRLAGLEQALKQGAAGLAGLH